jgi:hypothetical protein
MISRDHPAYRQGMREHVLQNLILGQLDGLDKQLDGNRIFAWRANTGAAETEGGARIKFGKRGQADISGVIRLDNGIGRRLEIEVKGTDRSGRRGSRSADQIAFGDRMLACGALYVVAWNLGDAIDPVCRALGIGE